MCGTLLSSRNGIAQRAKPTWAWDCYWCHRLIQNGDTYHEQKIAAQGSVQTVRGHQECLSAHGRESSEAGHWDDCEPIMEERLRGMTCAESWAIRHKHSPESWVG